MNEIENVFTSTVIQSRMSAVWFKDKELAFSFGCILAFSRLVSYKTNDYNLLLYAISAQFNC